MEIIWINIIAAMNYYAVANHLHDTGYSISNLIWKWMLDNNFTDEKDTLNRDGVLLINVFRNGGKRTDIWFYKDTYT